MINKLTTNESRCLDFGAAGIDITWGGNIQVHCITDNEYKERHVRFLCSPDSGWNCNSTEYEAVRNEFQTRVDRKNAHWTPLRGYAFRDLFPYPENPFWAWIDVDSFMGNFARYPYNILSQMSFMTATTKDPGPPNANELVYMAGQLTAFNLDDLALATAWKKFPTMHSAIHFTNYTDGIFPQSTEEAYWSYSYLQSDDDNPGTDLSFCIYPDIHGDDIYDGEWKKTGSANSYLISGRDILLASTSYNREEIEALFALERSEPIDDLG